MFHHVPSNNPTAVAEITSASEKHNAPRAAKGRPAEDHMDAWRRGWALTFLVVFFTRSSEKWQLLTLSNYIISIECVMRLQYTQISYIQHTLNDKYYMIIRRHENNFNIQPVLLVLFACTKQAKTPVTLSDLLSEMFKQKGFATRQL